MRVAAQEHKITKLKQKLLGLEDFIEASPTASSISEISHEPVLVDERDVDISRNALYVLRLNQDIVSYSVCPSLDSPVPS